MIRRAQYATAWVWLGLQKHMILRLGGRLAVGIDTLVATVKTGKNAMPPGGMCTDCTDDDYKNAIEYMSK
jgi:hypothetical protein